MFLKRGLLVAFLLLLTACSPLSPTSTVATTTTQPGSAAAGTGKIVGVLLDEAGEPISGLGVFLADVSQGPEPNSNIVSFRLQSSKQAITDEQGKFLLEEVPAGLYSLAVWTPNSSMLIPQPGSAEGSAIEVTVEPQRVTDVGSLKIRRPI